jgi:cytochrome c-type biogenesis protein CcmE
MAARMKFIIGGVVIVAALACLAFVGFQESKAYYITVVEYYAMRDSLNGETIRLAGDVEPGSVDRSKSQMEFVIGSPDSSVKVRYVGKDIIPDTFKDGSKALVEGHIAPDGVFLADHIEAKCASKYDAEYDKRMAGNQ